MVYTNEYLVLYLQQPCKVGQYYYLQIADRKAEVKSETVIPPGLSLLSLAITLYQILLDLCYCNQQSFKYF